MSTPNSKRVAVCCTLGAGDGGHHRALLDVGTKADGDGETGVGAHYGVVPDRRFVPVGYVTDDGGGGGDECIVGLKGDVVEKGHFGAVAGKDLNMSRKYN